MYTVLTLLEIVCFFLSGFFFAAALGFGAEKPEPHPAPDSELDLALSHYSLLLGSQQRVLQILQDSLKANPEKYGLPKTFFDEPVNNAATKREGFYGTYTAEEWEIWDKMMKEAEAKKDSNA